MYPQIPQTIREEDIFRQDLHKRDEAQVQSFKIIVADGDNFGMSIIFRSSLGAIQEKL